MVLPLVLTTLEYGREKVSELWVCVLGIMDVREGPIALAKQKSCKTVSASGNETWGATNESFVHDGDFEEILGQGSGFNVVVVSFADPSKKAQRSGPSKLKLEHA